MSRREIGKVTALTNPVSGHGAAIRAAQTAIARLQHRGVEVVEIIGDDAEDARYLAGAAVERGTDALMVTGGDGVVSNALQVLAGTDVPLGIIPAGTGNDHAREFGIPTKDPEAAADIVVDGWTETIDLGRIQCGDGRKKFDKWFGTVAATGFDSLVTDRANRMSWPHGRLRYYVAMLAELSQLRLLPFRLVLDGTNEIDADITLAAFGNTRSYGGGLLICPNADPTDGLLDITMAHSASRTKLVRLFPTVMKGTHVEPRRGEHGTRQIDPRRVPRHQRLRRRRLRVPAARRDLRGARRTADSAAARDEDHGGVTLRTPAPTSCRTCCSGGERCRHIARPRSSLWGQDRYRWVGTVAFARGFRRSGVVVGRALPSLTFSANQKTGTSMAARQPELHAAGQLLVQFELLNGRLRRHGQRRARHTHEPIRAANGAVHLERVAMGTGDEREI